ncbi:disks large-associated protein 5 [Rhinichthys klamathensis goyatoka]|uniref:disks large-associated protein 5 n=1 Tax=Rhinichthys klamathensis goyatoka TaxID=3034132 RepID=UPI0024B5A09F|nr:disks large-associated protein 5 [Rhinichthys klamathensis goyatoka]
MDSRFAHLYKRDSSVSMIRLKMSRRRSQSQKENREKIQNLRRHLDQLPEIELSMDASSIMATQDQAAKTKTANDANAAAAEERKKMLTRYKENKMLQKEKEKREKEKKGVFKVGLYKPQPLGYLPSNIAAPGRGKIAETNQSIRVTRSMMQNQKPAVERHAVLKKVETVSTTRAPTKNNCKALTSTKTRAATVEPSVRAPTTRSAAKTTPAAVVKPVAVDSRAMKTRSTVKCPAAPSSGRVKAIQGNTKTNIDNKPAEKKDTAVNSLVPEEEEPKAAPPSFAPQGFVFQPPVGLSSFEPAPLSPHSASAFLSPSLLSEASGEPIFPSPQKPVHLFPSLSSPPPSLSTLSPDLPTTPPSVSSPPPAPSSPQPSTSAAPLAPLEPQHDVAYFRSVMASETERLTGFSKLWESRFDDASIPEEMQDRMRTAVGQARLLMKERFGQFSGLVDDCELGRGEKITTCTDLQGFWDMVYFQVEDVNKKFDSLKEAEARDWKEEVRPVARKRVAKKPPVVGGKAGAGGAASAAVKSRLAAVKAAMRAKQAEQKASETSDNIQDYADSVPAATLPAQTVVFHGGFFQVESPMKPLGAVRRSCRISTVSSPCASKFSTPGRQCRSNAVSRASPLPCVFATPPRNHHPDVLPVSTPLRSAEPLSQSPRALQISPDHNQTAHVLPDTEPCSNSQPHDLSSTCTSHTQPEISNAAENSPVDQSRDFPIQSEHLADSSDPQLEECIPESMLSPSSQEEPQEDMVSEESLPAPTGADAGLDTRAQCSSHTSSLEAKAPASPVLMPSTPTKDPSISAALSNEVISACNSSPTRELHTDVEMTGIQDAEDATSLDFERYLQPTVRDSMSPGLAEERFSLGVEDAEMESPVTLAEERPLDVLATPSALPRMVFTPGTSQMSDNLLLFTPEQKERVRPSMCERDLIMFTPPTNK